MNTYIALLRGINVGGKNSLPMEALISMFEAQGFEDIKTYIQSGNVVFRSKRKCSRSAATTIATEIKNDFGFEPNVLLLTTSELRNAAKNVPFQVQNGKMLHLFFLAGAPSEPDLAKLDTLKASSERYKLDGAVFYLHAPKGIARSKLAANLEKALGETATGRNWNTVSKLVEMAGAAD